MSRPAQVAVRALLLLALAGCSQRLAIPGEAPAPTPSDRPAAPTPLTANGALDQVPTSCWGLGPEDCRRVVKELASELQVIDPPVTYIQVGPFGCEGVERCAKTLAARPHGGVTLDAASLQLLFEIRRTPGGADLMIDRREPITNPFEATSQPPLIAGAQPFELGHCGLWSGIDLGGSWWDPVGQVDSDHPDAINAAKGTITVSDPDHATFVSQGGLSVQLLRRTGAKFLPGCA